MPARVYAHCVRIPVILVALALVPAAAGLVGCGASVGGESAAQLVPTAQRESAAHLAVPMLEGAGSLAVGVPGPRPTVINMWASWCGPCRKEMPDVEQFATTHPAVRVVGVAVNDSVDDARAFAREVGVTFPLGFDRGDAVANAYAVSGLPTTVVLDREGRLAATWPGPVTSADLARLTAPLVARG